MKAVIRWIAGAAAGAAMFAAAPAQAQYYPHDRDDRDRDTVAEVVAGIAAVGAAVAAVTRGGRYDPRGYGYGYGRYGHDSPEAAVELCAREAQRIGHNVRITDVDRDDGYYRVRGRIEVVDYDDRRWSRRPDIDREDFTCYARNGRIYEFRV